MKSTMTCTTTKSNQTENRIILTTTLLSHVDVMLYTTKINYVCMSVYPQNGQMGHNKGP